MKITTIATGSTGNCYLVESTKERFLIECGIQYKKIMQKIDFKSPDFVFVSHEHNDHSFSAKKFADSGVSIRCSKGTADAIGLSRWQFKEPSICFEAVHDAAAPRMFMYDDNSTGERLFFATDTECIPHKINGITHLMIEANWSKYTEDENCEYIKRVKNTHMSLEMACDWIAEMDKSRLKEVRIIHMSSTNSHEGFFREKIASLVGVPVYVEKGV